ncbi:hypothetical protein GCK72_018413 [Caenorhabditis remanei]|uniref:Serpentine Receptor, class BC (Class B-like) n=1 Tax=Caenorhabditis remanei TaxID=31234 RepID=A0A6A5GBT3_CAERE|nr:hypothetical protein GCK72_018413 [Caenorhabditis remanei]KAF1751859.1 hypothetical protein GCK72_018413 [Caenorhabditis remanei]
MVVLNASFWIFTAIGVIVTFLTVCLSIYILFKYTIDLKVWNKIEYQFIFIRVFCDIFNGIAGCGYFVSSGFTLLYSDIVPFDVTFLVGLVGSNFLEMRSFLAAIIAIERVCATLVPLKYYHYRRRISNTPIIIFIVSTGLAVYVVLFGFCDFRLPLVPGCVNYACATPPCFLAYSSVTKVIYCSINALFSSILCCKLFLLSWRQASVPVDLRKANWISLTDGLSTLVFELLPTLIFDSRIIDIRAYGPVIGVLRQSGRAVEALAIVNLMERKNENKTWKKLEYQLILLRVTFDALNGMSGFTYISLNVIDVFYNFVPYDVSFTFGMLGFNLMEIRSFLAAIIAIERVLATTIPLKFYHYRSRVSNIIIVGFVVSLGLSSNGVLFGICEYRFAQVPGCTNFNCATPVCFQRYTSMTRMIYSTSNIVFSLVLCYKLFWLSWKQAKVSADIRKANLLSLTDGVSSLCFEMLPWLISYYGVVDIKSLGPVIGAFRTTGRVVEAVVMLYLMKKEIIVQPARASTTRLNW